MPAMTTKDRSQYHPVARRAMRLVRISLVGYALAAASCLLFITAFEQSASLYIYIIPMVLFVAMLGLNLVAVALAVVVIAKHRKGLDGMIALLYGVLPLIIIAVTVYMLNHAITSAH